VKYRNTCNYGTPESSITYKKIKTLRRAAEGFLYIRKIVDTECRFDIIAIDFTDGKHSIRHLKCAF
jgi:Holliday junction resolvase-like predicted endonuclease